MPEVTPPPGEGRVLVAGGAGFLGSWLCERLLDLGHPVVCVDNFATGSRDNVTHLERRVGFELIDCDISAELDVDGPLSWIFHLASPASPIQYLRLPIETLRAGSLGTFQILDLAKRKQARLILASTSEVYGDPWEHPQPETYWGNVNPVGPRSVYDEAKRFSEALTTAYRTANGLDTAIARIFNTYGPRLQVDDGRVVSTFIRQALDAEPLTVAGDGSQTRSLCYVDDTVEGLIALAASGQTGPINLGNPHEMTVLQIAEKVCALTGSQSSIELMEAATDDPKRRCPDITLARELLGWEPRTDADEGLSRTIAWFRAARG